MTRSNWFDPATNHPLLDEKVHALDSFMRAMADGTITEQELASQEGRVVDLMKEIDPLLSDVQHEAVTKLLLEMSAYNIMMTLRESQIMRLKAAFK
ncbi:MAG: hypothetical protein ABI743_02660 [bacterium]